MKKAAEAGHAEVQAARLAVSKSTNAQVKKFAQMLIDDHTKANAQLEQIASAKGVKLPTEPSLMHKSKMQLMKMADGADFDKRFAEDMGVEAHRETIELSGRKSPMGGTRKSRHSPSRCCPSWSNTWKWPRRCAPSSSDVKAAPAETA